MDQAIADRRTAKFGSYELDVRSGELRRNGSRVRLQEQPLAMLSVLLERAGDVVTRDELRARLWKADTFVDFDHGLNVAVAKLRTALNDSAEKPLYIETLPRHGYRFIAPVEWDGGTPQAPLENERSGFRPNILLAVLLVVAASIAVSAVIFLRSKERPAPSIRSVAVLPFQAGAKDIEYLGEGLSEALIEDLTTWPDLRVISRSSSFRFKGSTADPRNVAKQLGVDAIVAGKIERAVGAYRMQVELIRAADGAEVWSRRYSTGLADVNVLQRHVAADMALRLGLMRSDDFRSRQRLSPAYDLYLQGRYLWNKRGRDDVLRAIDCFERAVRLDPAFAPGYAGLALGYGALVGNRYSVGSAAELEKKSRAAANRAIELDPTLAEAYASRAASATSYYWDFAAAERDYRRAIELKPGLAIAHQWYSSHLDHVGRPVEARREIDTAQALEPFAISVTSFVCWNRMLARRYDEAIAFGKRMHDVDPTLVNQACVQWCHLMKGDYENAIAAAARVSPERGARMAAAYRAGGVRAFWKDRLDEFETSRNSYYAAAAAGQIGEVDRAFSHLEESFAERHPMLSWMYVDPRLDPLRSDPRFDDLARRIGLPQVKR